MKPVVLFKTFVRKNLVGVLSKLYSKPEGRKLLYEGVPYLSDLAADLSESLAPNHTNPYDLGTDLEDRRDVIDRPNVVFITGRFRSGSTLLWNIFRDIPNVTSYYEPFNERQWFNESLRGNHVDNTHLGVADYWNEYLGMGRLERYYNEDWIDKNLFMGTNSWDPDMVSYVDCLIRNGKKHVVLQFNRIDFRLLWFRRYYPRAKIVHIYRHPRDQWLSYIKGSENCHAQQSIKSLDKRDFFYLRRWGRDLKYIYPFLDESNLNHLYELFYYLWKLSFNHGKEYSDISFSFENLCENPKPVIDKLLLELDIKEGNTQEITKKIKKMTADKWKSYAVDDWFMAIERSCETTLTNFYLPRSKV